ncbi:MAG: SCO1664 family protein [Actinomycetota bacterium]
MSNDELIHDLLNSGEIEIVGRMPWSSNATFLVNLTSEHGAGQAIYKPLRGERPLWDFEPGLHRREVAAYRLSEAMGFGVVPHTVLREGPVGEGSMQWFVEADHQEHYFTIFEKREDLHDQLRLMAVLDIVANNTDRKSGHCLLGYDERVWGIDHGLCFAAEFKLRTVIWEFGGEPLPDDSIAPLQRLLEGVPLEIAALLIDEEVLAIQERAEWLLQQGEFPIDESGRRYPWPLV